MHIHQLLPYVLSTPFSTHPKPLTRDVNHSKGEGSIFSTLWDFPPFFGTVRLFFSEIFLLFLPSIFDILQQDGCSKNPKASPFYIFRHYATYRKLQKNLEKNSEFFFWIFSFLRAFVVSSCRKSGFRFRVFLSLRYGADLGRSRLVYYSSFPSRKTHFTCTEVPLFCCIGPVSFFWMKF